jgi:hypothetical protein
MHNLLLSIGAIGLGALCCLLYKGRLADWNERVGRHAARTIWRPLTAISARAKGMTLDEYLDWVGDRNRLVVLVTGVVLLLAGAIGLIVALANLA